MYVLWQKGLFIYTKPSQCENTDKSTFIQVLDGSIV